MVTLGRTLVLTVTLNAAEVVTAPRLSVARLVML